MSIYSKAPTAAKKIAAKTVYVRNEVGHLSKREQCENLPPTERQILTNKFTSSLAEARAAIADAEREADALMAIADGVDVPDHPLAATVAEARRMGAFSLEREQRLRSMAHRLRDSADRASTRLEQNSDDIRATLLQLTICDQLPEKGWDAKHTDLRALRAQYHSAKRAAKEAREQ